MNIEDYISSGILECYVLRQLSRTDSAKVEEMATLYPEVKKELLEIEESMEQYAQLHAKTPRAMVKEKLLKEISREEAQDEPQTKIVEVHTYSKAVNYLAAASVTLALLFGSTALYYFQQWKKASAEVSVLRLDNERIASYNTVINGKLKEDIQSKERLLSLLSDTSTKSVQLKGLPLSPASVAMVFWNKQTKSVYLDVKNLPKPPADKQYQLWALQDGVPVDAGVFEVANDSLQHMKNIPAAQAFAVTLENKGGSIAPTLDMMYLMGNI